MSRELKHDFDSAYNSIEKKFPFKAYLGHAVYCEMYSIVIALKGFIPEFKGKKLLDIGCGPMDKTGIMASLGFVCSAVDDLSDPWHLRDHNITRIKEYAHAAGITFSHQKVSDYSIPYPENSFDVVCALAVIEHLHESPRDFLNVMGNFAKANGLLVVSMPNSVSLRKRLSVLLGRTNYPPIGQFYYSTDSYRGHVREYTLAETVFILKETGFSVLHAKTFEQLAYKKLRFPLRQIYLALSSLVPTLRSSILVIARKPQGWMPAAKNEDKYRMAISKAVPSGVA